MENDPPNVPWFTAGRCSLDRLMKNIKQGTVIAFPNSVDERGNYCWDFRIEGGDPQQVVVERTDA